MTDHYKILKIPRSASPEQIKKAYRAAALAHHPDKGGKKENFLKVQEAYETLGNPDKKLLYDFELNKKLNLKVNPVPVNDIQDIMEKEIQDIMDLEIYEDENGLHIKFNKPKTANQNPWHDFVKAVFKNL